MDPESVIRAQHGDGEAFTSLALACGDRLYAIAHRILRDVDLAEVFISRNLRPAPGREGLPTQVELARATCRRSGRGHEGLRRCLPVRGPTRTV
jgi:hypothetical protein